MKNSQYFIIKSGKRLATEGIEVPNQESIRMRGEKETYKQSKILEADPIKQAEMNDKIKIDAYTYLFPIEELYIINLITMTRTSDKHSVRHTEHWTAV